MNQNGMTQEMGFKFEFFHSFNNHTLEICESFKNDLPEWPRRFPHLSTPLNGATVRPRRHWISAGHMFRVLVTRRLSSGCYLTGYCKISILFPVRPTGLTQPALRLDGRGIWISRSPSIPLNRSGNWKSKWKYWNENLPKILMKNKKIMVIEITWTAFAHFSRA